MSTITAPEVEPLLTSRQVADALSISPNSAERLLLSGAIPSCKIGRLRRVTPQALRNFIAQREKEMAELAK